jgi:hypothetical protein
LLLSGISYLKAMLARADLAETIRREFNSIEGIELDDYQLVSESDFSLADMRTMLRWDYDYLSYRGGTPDDVVPPGT